MAARKTVQKSQQVAEAREAFESKELNGKLCNINKS